MAVREDKTRVPVTIEKTFKEQLEKIVKAEGIRSVGNLLEKIAIDWYETNHKSKDVQR